MNLRNEHSHFPCLPMLVVGLAGTLLDMIIFWAAFVFCLCYSTVGALSAFDHKAAFILWIKCCLATVLFTASVGIAFLFHYISKGAI